MRRTKILGYGIALTFAVPSLAAAQSHGPGPLVGNYTVTSNTTVTVTSPMATTEQRVTHERLTVQAVSDADLLLDVTNDRGERCRLRGDRNGQRFTLRSGQRCTMTDPQRNIAMNLTLRSGSGSLSGENLSIRLSWSVASHVAFMDVTGTAAQHTSGRRTGGGPPTAVAAAPSPSSAPSPLPIVPMETETSPVMPTSSARAPSSGSTARRVTRQPTSRPTSTDTAPLPSTGLLAPTSPPAAAPAGQPTTPAWSTATNPTVSPTLAPAPWAPPSTAPIATAPTIAAPRPAAPTSAPTAPVPAVLSPSGPGIVFLPNQGFSPTAPNLGGPPQAWSVTGPGGWGASVPYFPVRQPTLPTLTAPWSAPTPNTTRPGQRPPSATGPAIILAPGTASF